jgi:hypothetical protein
MLPAPARRNSQDSSADCGAPARRNSPPADCGAPARRNYVLNTYREYPERDEGAPFPIGAIGPVDFFEDVNCTIPCAAGKYATPLCFFDGERLAFAPDAYPEDVLFVYATYLELFYQDGGMELSEQAARIALVACELQRKSLNPDWTGTRLTARDIKFLKKHLENPANLPNFIEASPELIALKERTPLRVGALELPFFADAPSTVIDDIEIAADGSWSISASSVDNDETLGVLAHTFIEHFLDSEYPNARTISALAGFSVFAGLQLVENLALEFMNELSLLHRMEISFRHIFHLTCDSTEESFGAIAYYTSAE